LPKGWTKGVKKSPETIAKMKEAHRKRSAERKAKVELELERAAAKKAKKEMASLTPEESQEKLLTETAELLQELLRRREEEAIRYYKPNRAQYEFHYATNDRDQICRNRILQGSNKVGKTCGGVVEDICHALGYRPWLEKDDPNYKMPVKVPNQGLVLGETIITSVDKKLVPEMINWIPKRCRIETKKNPQGVIVKIHIPYGLYGEKCGSTIYFGSYDQAAETQEGVDWNWVHYDEPPPHDTYIAVERGKIAGDARSWMTMTPLKEAWILDDIIEPAAFDRDIKVIHGEIWDNAEENGGVLKKEAIDEFIKKLDPDEYDARILGKWKHLSGLVYAKWWKDEAHLIDDFDMAKCFRIGWTPYESVDPHDNRPTCWLFGAMGPDSRLYVYDYLLASGSIAEIVQQVKVKRAMHGYAEPRLVVLDKKHGQKENAALADGKSWHSELERAGIRRIELSDSKPGDVDFGHKKVKEWLELRFSTLHNKEMPNLMFFKRACGGQGGPIYQFKRYSYDDMGEKSEKNPNPKPKDLHKDFPDCIRYMVMKDPKYIDPEKVKAQNIYAKQRYEEFVGVRRKVYGIAA
jgi:phage terminase large subunit-like protein